MAIKSKAYYKRYWFVNGELHKTLHVNRMRDIVVTWNFEQHARMTYLWSDFKRKRQKAFTVKEVANILERHRDRVWTYIKRGMIEYPHKAYKLDDPERKTTINFYSEDEVKDIYEYALTVHRGRPRRDGKIKNDRKMTPQEVRAVVKTDKLFYIKNDDGEFVPMWDEELF